MATIDERLDRIESLILRQQGQIELLTENSIRQQTQIEQLNENLTRQNEQILQQGQRQETILYEVRRILGNVAETANRADSVGQSNRLALETLTRLVQAIQADILRLQVDIRGVQVENQRILHHLFGQGEGRED